MAVALGAARSWPVLHKDVVKEQLADVLFEPLGGDRPASQRLGHVATVLLYDLAERLLAAGTSVIVESNFPAEFSSAPLRSAAERTGAGVVQVVLTSPPEVMSTRFAARKRHPVHVLEELPPLPPYEPLDLPGVRIDVDTTTLPVDLGPILAVVGAVNEG